MTNEDPNKSTKKGRGRPPKDWELLFTEWLKSGLPKNDFLALKGIDYRGGTAAAKTRTWTTAIDEVANRLNDMKLAQTAPSAKAAALVDNLTQKEVKQADGTVAVETTIAGISPANSWQQIQRWRNAQGATDWKTADSIRMHIQLILKTALKKNETNNSWYSDLKPSEVRQLAAAANDIQRSQRLSLGLSTENIGVDMPQTHIETPQEGGGIKPNLFVVEISKSGRFVNARPRRVS